MADENATKRPRDIEEKEFLRDDEEAKRRYDKWKDRDPFPGVAPALLHSGQIRDYILKTGMLSPFTRDDLKNIKPASLEIPFEGRVVYWDKKEEKFDETIVAGQGAEPRGEFTLEPNSIAFVQVRPRFQLPHYIAVRFNLKITHVYRGLLLGTGPLVDPGYQGHLYIPLHNLTSRAYTFLGGQGLLWMEFTKLQWADDRHQEPADDADVESVRPEGFVPFPSKKIDMPLENFFEKASGNRPIASSIPQEIEKAREASEAAEKYAKTIRNLGFALVIGILVGLISIFKATWDLAYSVKHGIGDKVNQLEDDRDDIQARLESLSEQMQSLTVAKEEEEAEAAKQEEANESGD